MRVLVFAPHPDDELIGCGGSLLKHVDRGSDVSVVYLTSGEAGSREYDKLTLARTREAEAIAAAASLGIAEANLRFLRNRDGYLAPNDTNFVETINLIREIRPDLVYLPHALDGHPDHAVAHQLAMKAIGCAAGPWFQETTGDPWVVGTVLAYEVWTPITAPNYLEDTTEVIERQLEALRCHESQLGDISYDAMVRGLNAYRGAMLGNGRYAEAFQILNYPTSAMTGSKSNSGLPWGE